MFVEQRSDQTVHGPVLALVVGALDEELLAVAPHGDLAGDVELE